MLLLKLFKFKIEFENIDSCWMKYALGLVHSPVPGQTSLYTYSV